MCVAIVRPPPPLHTHTLLAATYSSWRAGALSVASGSMLRICGAQQHNALHVFMMARANRAACYVSFRSR